MSTYLTLIVIIVAVGAIVAAVAGVIGSSRRADFASRYAAMPLAQLQAAPQPWTARASVTSKAIFGDETTTWFESLLEKTYAQQADPAS